MLEAHAIVYSIYKILPNYNDRIQFTMEIFRNIRDFYSVKNSIEFSDDVFYNKEKVELYFIKSISEFDNFISHHSVNAVSYTHLMTSFIFESGNLVKHNGLSFHTEASTAVYTMCRLIICLLYTSRCV